MHCTHVDVFILRRMPFPPGSTSRALTQEEANALKVNVIMPVAVMAAVMFAAMVMTAIIVLPLWDRPFVKVFAGLVGLLLTATCVAVWMHVRNNLGDLRDGIAQIKTGRVTARRQTGRAPYTFYVTLDGIGEVIVMGADYDRMKDGTTFTIAYSPRINRVWTAEER